MKPEDTLDAADKSFDENEFARARDEYREALASGCSRANTFANLMVSEEMDAIMFRHALVANRPNWTEARLDLALAFLRARKPERAVVESEGTWVEQADPRNQLAARVVRYRAAIAARAYAVAFADFAFLWEKGRSDDAQRKLRRVLLKEIAGIADASGADLISTIMDGVDMREDTDTQTFLLAKSAELRALEKCLPSKGGG